MKGTAARPPQAGTGRLASEVRDGSGRLAAVEPPRGFSPKMLEALVCPVSGSMLIYDAGQGELISRSAGLAFPIRSGIPIMLIDEARKIEDK